MIAELKRQKSLSKKKEDSFMDTTP